MCMRSALNEYQNNTDSAPQDCDKAVTYKADMPLLRQIDQPSHASWSYNAIHGEYHEETKLVLVHGVHEDEAPAGEIPPPMSRPDSAETSTSALKDPHASELHLFTCFRANAVAEPGLALSKVVEGLTKVLDNRNDSQGRPDSQLSETKHTQEDLYLKGEKIESFFWAQAPSSCCQDECAQQDKYRIMYNTALENIIAAMVSTLISEEP